MPERQPDPAVNTFTTFGALLRYLRERAHLSQRELAALIGYHFSYISYLEKNTRVVDEATLLGRFIPALGLDDEPVWAARLLALARLKKQEATRYSKPSDSIPDEKETESLPVSLTAIIGRETESARLQRMLLEPQIHLITIVGPPGVGKTCLALHVARLVSTTFTNGVVFVDLTPAQTPDQLLPALAAGLGVSQPAKSSLEDALKAALADKKILILLDNFEQIVEAAPQLIPLLGTSSKIKMLVTSREALRLRGEHEFHLTPLAIPGETQTLSIAQLQAVPAVSLFIERAQTVQPEFSLDEKNAAQVAELCRRLDGLPLAIELASARTRALSPSTMLQQLDRRFEWLSQGARDLPAWRQTLRGAIEWSYLLLSEKERVLFRRLSIFTGGWTLQAAEDVCGGDDACPRPEILGLLLQLVNKSLVIPEPEADRYHFLETLREFAYEELERSGEIETSRRRHFDHYLKFVQMAKPHLDQGEAQVLWLNRTDRDYGNLRLALDWVVADPARAVRAMDFGRAIHVFWLTRSHFSEARHWLTKILALDSSPRETRADLLRFASDYAGMQGDYANAVLYEEEAMQISRALGDEAGIFFSLDGIAMFAGMQGDYAQAATLLEQVLDYRRRTDNPMLLTATLNNLAIATRRLGNLERAKRLYEEIIPLTRKMENTKSLAHALTGLADINVMEEQYEPALTLLRESISLRHIMGDLKGIASSLNSMAACCEKRGDLTLATQLESAASKIRASLGMPILPATRAENDAFLTRLRVGLGDKIFETVWANALTLTLDEVVALATAT